MNKYIVFVFKDFKLIKFCFAVITIYLLYDELRIFFIEKPTLSSTTKSRLRPGNYPDIIICPVPGYDQAAIQRLGYESSYYYSMGRLSSGLTGWFGNQTQLTRDSFVFKSPADCPDIAAKFRVKGRLLEERFEMFLTRGIFPNGICCKANTPKLAESGILNTIYFTVTISEYRNSQVTGFKMLLSDRESSAFFMLNKFNMEGSQLVSRKNLVGQEKYKIKILEETHQEDDPNYSCRNYLPTQYDLCLETEFTRQTLELLNCTPPWMTDSRELWCPPLLQLDRTVEEEMILLFDRILHGNGEVGHCYVPCKKTR